MNYLSCISSTETATSALGTNVSDSLPRPLSLIQDGHGAALSALSYDGCHNILTDFLPRKRMDTVGSCCPHLTWLRGAVPASAVWQHLQKRSRSWHFLPPPALSPPPLSTAQQWALHTKLLIHLLLSTLLGWTPSGKQQTPHKIPIQKWYPHFRMHCFLYFHLSLWLCSWKLLNTSGNLK